MTISDNTPADPRAGAGPQMPSSLLDPSRVGLLQWFHVGDHELVERALGDLDDLGVQLLRTGVSWADWHTEAGRQWYDWLLPRLAERVQVLPCLVYTPPSLGIVPKTASPPRDPKAYADFLDELMSHHGGLFEWVELWNEPNNISEWDWTLDNEWERFCEMIGKAAYWARHLGKKTLLGGLSPVDPNWLALMYNRGVMRYIDAVGIHGFPGLFESTWDGWPAQIRRVRDVIEAHGGHQGVWITEAGFSTWKHEECRQLEQFIDAATSEGAERLYWYSLYDLAPQWPTIDGFHSDDREYHFGMRKTTGQDKLLCRAWRSAGLAGLEEFVRGVKPPRAAFSVASSARHRPALITGGAGFIGTNLADRLLSDGRRVIIFDNLSRSGSERNCRWLAERHGSGVSIEVADVRNAFALRSAVRQAGQVFHLAAQVAVTTALATPIDDFEVNVRGTMNLLEAIRECPQPPPLVFTSTNKVYGALEDVVLRADGRRYEPAEATIRSRGISEDRPLDFHSPYGCSKGAADQYVLDYSRSYGLATAVLRMSCIYGPHQFGNADQGWVAHFLISAMEDRPLTIYGDGQQVRDVLFIDDLVAAMMLAQERMDELAGRAFNIGGGPDNTVSLLELLESIDAMGLPGGQLRRGDWRQGDQRYYVSDTARFAAATGWRACVGVEEGLRRLCAWLTEYGTPRIAGRTLLKGA